MAFLEDRRPTLASWPKRIEDWEELPAVFRPELASWRARGLPPENVTYIPSLSQYDGGPAYAIAWLERRLLIQTLQNGRLEVRRLDPGDVAQVRCRMQLLRCEVTAFPRSGGPVAFSYNKTKEDQLLPVLNLLLGNPPDFVPPAHPDTPAWRQLQADSYAMYYTAALCERFGGPVRDLLWLRGRSRSLLYILRRMPDPEYLLTALDRGLAVLEKDFYGVRAAYLPWRVLHLSSPEEGAASLPLTVAHGPGLTLPLLPGQAAQVQAFFQRLTKSKQEE